MPGPAVNMGATVICAHGGQAQCIMPIPTILIDNQPAIAVPANYVIAGCAFPPPPAGNGPCVTGILTSASSKVITQSGPLLIQGPPGTCVPTGTPLIVAYAGQAKVIAQ